MDPVITKILEGTPYAGMGSTLERNALIGYVRNLINESKYTVEMILSMCESVGYQRQMAEEVFKELTGLSPKLIVNNNEYYNMPAGVPNMCIAWGISKSNKEKAFYLVPFEYGYATMEIDGINAPIPTVISATIPEAFNELKKVAKGIQTLDKIITKKLLETEDVQTDAHTVHQVNLPYAASPLQVLKKNFKDKVLSVSEFERQASKLLASEEITVDEAEDLMAWKQDLIDEDETYGNDVLELDEQWKPIGAEDIDENDPDYENRVKEAFTQLSGMIEEFDIFKDYAKRSGKDRLFDTYIQLAHEVADEWDIKPEALLGEMTLENPKLVKRIEDQDVENFNQDVKNWTKSQEKFPWKGGSKKKANEEDLDSFDYTYSLLVNGNIDLYKERLNKMSKVELMNYIAWAEEMGISREELKLHYITASKNIKSNIKKDSNFEKALSYVEERISNDNNNENDSYPLAFEEAENLFGVDADELQEEYDRRTMTWRNASLKKKANNCATLNNYITKETAEIWDDGTVVIFNEDGSRKEDKKFNSKDEAIKELRKKLFASKKQSSQSIDELKQIIKNMKKEGKSRTFAINYLDGKGIDYKIINEILNQAGYNNDENKVLLKGIQSCKKITAENMTLDDIEAEDNKDQVQEEIEKIDETPAEDIFSETTPEDYLDKALQEDKVDTINDVVSKCIDKFSEKFKDFDKYQVKILSYNTKVLGDDKPVQEEMVEDKELNANAILQVILQITNNAEEENIKKVLAVFSITNGELHWTGTVRGENDQVVAFTEEGLDALFEVEEVADQELEDII